MKKVLARYPVALVLIALCVGCGDSDRLPTAPVTGTVLYNGDPLPQGSLLFVPEGGGPSAQGKIEPDGSFTMGTYTESDGAILGKHKVIITAMTAAGGSGLPEDAVDAVTGAVSMIPDRYGDLEKSGLTIQVKEENEPVTFKLTAAEE
jgi:hypothetical protein